MSMVSGDWSINDRSTSPCNEVEEKISIFIVTTLDREEEFHQELQKLIDKYAI